MKINGEEVECCDSECGKRMKYPISCKSITCKHSPGFKKPVEICEWKISQDIISKYYSVYREIYNGLIETISPFVTEEEAQDYIDKGELNV